MGNEYILRMYSIVLERPGMSDSFLYGLQNCALYYTEHRNF